MNAPHGKAGAFGERGSRASLPRRYLVLIGLTLSGLALLLSGAPALARSATEGGILPPKLTESFPAKWVAHGGTIAMSFTLSNPNQEVPYDSVSFSDSLPSGLVLGNPVNASGTCLSGYMGTFTGAPGGHQLSLSIGEFPAGAHCTLSVNVVGTESGRQTNTTGAPTATYLNASQETVIKGSPAVANVIVLAPPKLRMHFVEPTVPLHGTASLQIKIRNPAPNPTALTGVSLTDNLPANLQVASPSAEQNTCGGTWQGAAGSSKVQLSGGTIAAGTECELMVDVSATGGGQANDTAGPVSSDNGGVGNSAHASLFVAQPPTIAVAVNPSKVVTGHTARVTFTLANPNSSSALHVLVFYVRLSRKVTVAPQPHVISTCGGTLTATPGQDRMRFRNGQLAPGSSCQISVTILAGGLGMKAVETTRLQGRDTIPGNRAVARFKVLSPPRHHHSRRHHH